MSDTSATPAPAPQPAPDPVRPAVPRSGHRIVDPADASPIGHPDGSDFVPKPQVTHPLTVVLPGPGQA